jgi:hypothetical protein
VEAAYKFVFLPSKRNSFGSNTFLKTAITKNHIRMVVEDVIARSIVRGSKVSFSGSKTHSIGDPFCKKKEKEVSLCVFFKRDAGLLVP